MFFIFKIDGSSLYFFFIQAFWKCVEFQPLSESSKMSNIIAYVFSPMIQIMLGFSAMENHSRLSYA